VGGAEAQLDPWDGDALISTSCSPREASADVSNLVAPLNPAEVHVIITARVTSREASLRSGRPASATGVLETSESSCMPPARRGRTQREKILAQAESPGNPAAHRRVVPLERVTVGPAPAGSAPSILGERFAEVLGVEAARLVQPKPVNTSLGAHSVELLRRVNGAARPGEGTLQLGFRDGLSWRVLAGRAGLEPAIALTADQLAWVHEQGKPTGARGCCHRGPCRRGAWPTSCPPPSRYARSGRADHAAPTERELL
jgi:hypothetical protein